MRNLYRGQWRDKVSNAKLDSDFSRAVGGERELIAELGFEPNFSNFPCMSNPVVGAEMQKALPCSCGGVNLTPVSDCRNPPTIAISCDDCGEIEGDALTLMQAIENWNMRYD